MKSFKTGIVVSARNLLVNRAAMSERSSKTCSTATRLESSHNNQRNTLCLCESVVEVEEEDQHVSVTVDTPATGALDSFVTELHDGLRTKSGGRQNCT